MEATPSRYGGWGGVTANILNKQSRTSEMGCSSSLGVGRGPNKSSSLKNKLVTKDLKKPRTWTNSLDKDRRRSVEYKD
jgi:hypothetical protein